MNELSIKTIIVSSYPAKLEDWKKNTDMAILYTLQLRPNGLLEHTGYRARSLAVHHQINLHGARVGGTKTLKIFFPAMPVQVIFILMQVWTKII